jgi:putative ABC transport system substrate-binding protein
LQGERVTPIEGISRRVLLMGAVLFGMLLPAGAQPPSTIPRVGVLRLDARPEPIEDLREGLRQLGWVEGRTVVLEIRTASGRPERLPDLAADLVRRQVDVIVTHGPQGVHAARDATRIIPIVLGRMDDADGHGFVANFARPEGNVTGLSFQAGELAGKWLQLLREMLPRLDRVALLWDTTGTSNQLRTAQEAARTLGVAVRVVEVRGAQDLKGAIEIARRERVDALVILGSALLSSEAERLAELTTGARIPAIYYHPRFTAAGGLLSYGPRGTEFSWRRAAVFVDRLLKGARPADLPVEQPTQFDLVVNAKTARRLGVTVPQSLLLQANEIIQ